MSLFKMVEVVSYSVQNWEQAKKFYNEVLEWPVAWASDEMGWIEYGRDNETHISISRWDGPGPLPVGTGAIAVFSVEDARTVIAKLRACGVRCDDVVEVPGVVLYGTFYDPDGNRFQVASSPNNQPSLF
jgi:predicted enzyme related to lactoylglutathione lyase